MSRSSLRTRSRPPAGREAGREMRTPLQEDHQGSYRRSYSAAIGASLRDVPEAAVNAALREAVVAIDASVPVTFRDCTPRPGGSPAAEGLISTSGESRADACAGPASRPAGDDWQPSPLAPDGSGRICGSFILRSRGSGLPRGKWEV